tara:strand:- start:1982 stop:2533 length:552 start_codon:yes stop_codon:yes gene_type:complete
MKIIKTKIKDLVILEPSVFEDKRGYFMESFKNSWFVENFPSINFIQENESKSVRGVLRGLHFQNPPYDQTKLVRVINGKVLDVVVDLRKSSSTYGMSFTIELSDLNKKQLLVPKGFAHGFLVKSNTAIFSYKVDNIYSKNHENGIIWNDKFLDIDWSFSEKNINISEKDKQLSNFHDFKNPFK